MLHGQRLVTVSHRLWEDLTQRAAKDNLSAEEWSQGQLGAERFYLQTETPA